MPSTAQLLIDQGRVSTVKNRFHRRRATVAARGSRGGCAIVGDGTAEPAGARRTVDGGVRHRVLSDYGKGVLADGVARDIIGAARAAGRPVIVDPKGSDYDVYAGATALTPNRHEADATGMAAGSDAEIEAAARALIARLAAAGSATRGAQGLSLVRACRHAARAGAIGRGVRRPGAGDTVIATSPRRWAAVCRPRTPPVLANVAAAVVVAKLGTATCSWPSWRAGCWAVAVGIACVEDRRHGAAARRGRALASGRTEDRSPTAASTCCIPATSR